MPKLDFEGLYNPDNYVEDLDESTIDFLTRSRDQDAPFKPIDPDYMDHIRRFHGGQLRRTWFKTSSGRIRRAGRFLNFASEESLRGLPPEEGINGGGDCRWDWALLNIQANANTASTFASGLFPFCMLYSGDDPPEEMTPYYQDFLCLDHRGDSKASVVLWDNSKATEESTRCEQAGIWMSDGKGPDAYTEYVSQSFLEFIGSLRLEYNELD